MASVFTPKGRNVYRIEFRDQNGQLRVVSSGLKDKRLAESLADKLEEDVSRLLAGKEPRYPQLTGKHLGLPQADNSSGWDSVVAAYLNERERQGSGKESDHYRDSRFLLARIQRECGWKVLRDIRADQFTEFLGRLAAAGRAPRTQNRYFETLRAACNFWGRQGWLSPNPMDKLKPIKVGQTGRRRLRRAYTLEEFQSLLTVARLRRQLAYKVAAFSGIRRGELRRLQKQDRTPVGPRPRWHTRATVTKNGMPINLPMTPACAEALRSHWERLPSPTSPLVIVPDKVTFKADLDRAKIAPVDVRGRHADFHSFRYLFCWLCAQKLPIEVVAKLMRHGSLNLTTAIYLDLGLDRDGDGGWVLPSLTGADPKRQREVQGQSHAVEGEHGRVEAQWQDADTAEAGEEGEEEAA
jgi:integrase